MNFFSIAVVWFVMSILAGPLPASGDTITGWFDPAWNNRSTIMVSNPGGGLLNNFQVHLSLDSTFDFANANVDGSDVRFTSGDGTTLIPYWIESWNPVAKSASIWINIPAIAPSGTTLYLYHGNQLSSSASNGTATFDFFDSFEPGDSVPGYYLLGSEQTALVKDQIWETSAPHTLSVLPNNSGGYAYRGYYGLQAGCGGVGLAFSNDLSRWTKYVGNPLFVNGRWPSVLKKENIFYMLYTQDFCATSHINLATSSDGVNFSNVKTIVPAHSGYRNQNSHLFYNQEDGKYYIYWYSGDDTTFWEIRARNASTPEGLDDPSSEIVVLRSTDVLAAPNMLLIDGTYFLSTEILDSANQWATKIYSSSSPTSGFLPLPGNPVLADGSACFFQHVIGTQLHNYYCKATENIWTVDHRVADLTAGRILLQEQVPAPSRWTASGGTWTSATDTQQDGSTGGVVKGSIGSSIRELLLSSYTGTDYVLEAYGKLLGGNAWGLGARATDKYHLYSSNLYENLDSTNNLYEYSWLGGGVATLAYAATGQVDMGSWNKLSVKVHGNMIDVYKDDVLKLQTTSTQYASGAVALFGSPYTVAEFNNVLVRKYEAVEPTAAVASGTATAVASVSLDPVDVPGGSTSQGTVWLNGIAPAGGVLVSLNDNSPAAAVPATVTIPAGDVSAAFTITTTSVTSSTLATISAGYGGVIKTAVLTINPVTIPLFSDDFTRAPGTPNQLSPWTSALGSWAVTGGVLQGSGLPFSYSQSYYAPTPLWDNYAVEGRFQFPSAAFGGGIGCRVNPATGAQYSAWIFPDNSEGGKNVLKLGKLWSWSTFSGTSMAEASLPSVGTGWHTLKIVCNGNRIQVYYDGTSKIDVRDNNYDSRPAYLNGGIGVAMLTLNAAYTMSVDNVVVSSLSTNQAPVATNDSYSTSANKSLNQAAPGVLSNDSDPEGATLTAQLVSGPSHGTLTLNSNGSFAYTPTASYVGSDSFTYRASDGNLMSNIATVTITIAMANQSPVATNDSYSTSANTAMNQAAPGVLSNDSDPEGATLTAQLVSGPSHGTLTLNSNGSFVFSPIANYVGSDTFTYRASDGTTNSNIATVTILVASSSGVLFSDDFTRPADASAPLSPWTSALGSWAVTGGVLQGSGSPFSYSHIYYAPTPLWENYSVEGRFQFPSTTAFGGGIGCRVNPATGAQYSAWIFPDNSEGGGNMLKLGKLWSWSTYSGTSMAEATLPSVGTGWHTLKMVCNGNRIQVYYDGILKLDVTDNNYDSRPAYLTGGIGVAMLTLNAAYTMSVDKVVVSSVNNN
ncbi:MAG: DUF2341 domain-containing protein [Deltaproteobacteria bacterium]|nr:DUF2341 domain-containing protein [Deltaproteobacteria bacterium]